MLKAKDNIMIRKQITFCDKKHCFTTHVTSLSYDSKSADNYLFVFNYS